MLGLPSLLLPIQPGEADVRSSPVDHRQHQVGGRGALPASRERTLPIVHEDSAFDHPLHVVDTVVV